MDAEEIVRRLEAIEERLSRVEARSVAPPPILLPTSQPSPETTQIGAEAESRLGSTLFAVLGAGLLSLALLTLTSYLVARGLIAPRTQYGLAWTAVALFACGGEAARRRSSLVGDILVGLASLGAYLTSAGGQATFRLYGDETTIALVVIVALVNVIYGATRGRPIFIALGLIGGAAAAIGAAENYAVATTIGLAVSFAGGFASVRRGWPALVWGSWLASYVALMFAYGRLWEVWFRDRPSPGPMYAFVPLMIATAIATYFLRTLTDQGSVSREMGHPSGRVLALPRGLPAFAVAAPFTYFVVGSHGGSAVFGAGLALAWAAFSLWWAYRPEAGGHRSFLVAAYVSGTIAAVQTLPEAGQAPTWFGLAVLAGVEAVFGRGRLLLAGSGWLLISTNEWYPWEHRSALSQWSWTAVAVASAVISLVLLWGRFRWKPARPWPDLMFTLLAAGTYVVWAGTRLAQAVGAETYTLGFVLAGFSTLVLGALMRRPGARHAGWILIAGATASVLLHDLDRLDFGVRLAVLTLFGVAALAGSAFYSRRTTTPPAAP